MGDRMIEHTPYGEDEVANRIYQLALLAAERITPESLAQFRSALEGLRAYHGDYPYYKEWLAACDTGADAVAKILTDATEHGRYMRSVAPLRPHFVTQEERDAHFRP